MALFEDVYTISAARSGTATVKKLALTGWSNNSTWLEHGKLYWKKTTGDELELYRDEDKAAGDLVCSGAINADGTVTLDEDNSSGISGSAFVSHTTGEESTGDIIVTYCYEDDLNTFERDLTDFLDTSSQFLGDPRFEQPMRAAKHKIDEVLKSRLEPYFRKKNNREVDLAAIAKPRQLAEAQALYAMYYIYIAVNNGDEAIKDLAKDFRRDAEKAANIVQLELDFEGDDVLDAKPANSGGRLTR